jgi:hypothetical protein
MALVFVAYIIHQYDDVKNISVDGFYNIDKFSFLDLISSTFCRFCSIGENVVWKLLICKFEIWEKTYY